MKAAVCYEFKKPLVVEEVEIDSPKWGEVLVRMEATAICHSDIHYIEGERAVQPPLVVGHEGAGTVEEVGQGVVDLKVGDRVALSLLRQCGRCFYCTLGMPYHCEGHFALATESRLRNHAGVPLGDGDLGTSAFAERAVVDQSQVVRIPDDISLDRACLLACGVITGAGAVLNTARVRPGSSVAVIGCGGVGLNAIQGAVLAGARHIIGLDTNPAKLEAALEFGATHTIHIGAEDAAGAVREVTDGRGADYAFVTVGTDTAVTQGFATIRTAGTLVLVGLPAPGVTSPLPIREFAWAGQHLIGSCMGSARLRIDVPRYIDLYRQGRLKLDELITKRYPLTRINEAIDAVKDGKARRNIIMFGDDVDQP